MKYGELISFEPITSVVKLVESGSDSAAENIVKTYVFSRKIKEDLHEAVLKNLNPVPVAETRECRSSVAMARESRTLWLWWQPSRRMPSESISSPTPI